MARPGKDILGKRYGCLTVLGKDGLNENHQVMWLVKCDCGNVIHETAYNLWTGRKKHCSKACPLLGRKYVGEEHGDFVITEKLSTKIVKVKCTRCGKEKDYPINQVRSLKRCACNPLFNCRGGIEIDGEMFSRRTIAKLLGISKQRLAQRIVRYGATKDACFPKEEYPSKMGRKPKPKENKFSDADVISILNCKVAGGTVYITRDICRYILKMLERLKGVTDDKQDNKQEG